MKTNKKQSQVSFAFIIVLFALAN